MSDGRNRSGSTVSLEAPERQGIQDPGAHELTSDSDDHFSDAQSARPETPAVPASPVPKLRVEKVDDEPSYGEVPGTDAYDKRTGDAAPDEIAIIPDANTDVEPTATTQSNTPGGQPIPKTVVDETVDVPGSKTHQFHEDMHKADATPDYVRKPDGTGEVNTTPASLETTGEAPDAAPLSPALKSPTKHRRKSSVAKSTTGTLEIESNEDNDEDGFGDDFDEFEEGAEDADFDDFDDGFQEAEAETPPPVQMAAPPSIPTPSFPILDLDGLDSEDILSATEPYLDALFSPDLADLPILPSPPKENPIFFNPRSASLWSQLAAPPPLQPPDWIRSRIRRLFLVSLGVPVDLDEILPASKQKKLVLPSLHRVTSNGSLRTSSDSRSVSQLRKEGANDSTASLDSQGKEKPRSPSKRRKRPAPEPSLDLVAAKQFCTTTDEALGGMTDMELRAHVKKLEEMEGQAKDLLEYWKKKTDEKIGDREAFEGVIENLVKHARKTRK